MSHDLTRRQWLLGSALTGLAAGGAACKKAVSPTLSSGREAAAGAFAHGIASGDPTSDAVILWTRITPDDPSGGAVDVDWAISKTADMAEPIAGGTTQATRTRDWTVKIDADGLPSGTPLYYQFTVGDTPSQIGQTKTLPDGALDSVRFAVMSCANWQHGYFNAYDHIARQAEEGDGFDAIIHLGDYYYEYGAKYYASEAMIAQGRVHLPAHEIITLDDYRQRHAQYRSDPSLQAMTATAPLITIWDDHETSNDSWQNGADNHQANEGEWTARRDAAMRAYYDWMPIREPAPGSARETLFRDYSFGNLLSLVTVETRLTARAEPLILENDKAEIEADPQGYKDNLLGDPSREMFGRAQEDYIIETLAASKADGVPWRVLANQVIMGRLLTTDLTPYVDETAVAKIEKDWAGVRDMVELSKHNLPVYPDSWDGYPAARDRFYDRLNAAGVNDIFVVTGDAHEFWVNDLTQDGGTKVGLECVTTSVSSETIHAYMGEATSDYCLLLTQTNPDARYYNGVPNGYLDITFTRDKADVKMVGLSTVNSTDYTAAEVAGFTVKRSGNTIKATRPRGLSLTQRALFSGLG